MHVLPSSRTTGRQSNEKATGLRNGGGTDHPPYRVTVSMAP